MMVIVDHLDGQASKLDSKLNLSTGGYNKRAATLITGINELLNQVSNSRSSSRSTTYALQDGVAGS